jgi:hypothetical protein
MTDNSLLDRLLVMPVNPPGAAAASAREAELTAQLAALQVERDELALKLQARAGIWDGRPAAWSRALFGLVEAMPGGMVELDYRVLSELGADIQRRAHPVLEKYALLDTQAQAERSRQAAAAYRDRLAADNELAVAYAAAEYPGSEPTLTPLVPDPGEPLNGDTLDSQAEAPSEAPSPDLTADPADPA